MNDALLFTPERIDYYVDILARSYEHLRISDAQIMTIKEAWSNGDLALIVQIVADAYQIHIKNISVTLGSPKVPKKYIAIVTPRTKSSAYHIYFRCSKEYLLRGSRAFFIFAIAHELAHVRLFTDEHSLRLSEVATDMLILVIGLGLVYIELQRTCSSSQAYGYIPRRYIEPVLVAVQARTLVRI